MRGVPPLIESKDKMRAEAESYILQTKQALDLLRRFL